MLQGSWSESLRSESSPRIASYRRYVETSLCRNVVRRYVKSSLCFNVVMSYGEKSVEFKVVF